MADSKTMKEILYPESKPFNQGSLQVDHYTLPYEEFGNPDGIPIVYLHGGPGLGSSPPFHRYFDPKAFRIIVYDQRGAGKSQPSGDIKRNTPDALAEDLEKLRSHLGIDQWHVYGGSWGSTLALLYAEKYPDKVTSLTLRGIYLLRQKDNDICYQAADILQPEDMKRLRDFLPENERADVIESLYQRIFDSDPAVHLPAARVVSYFGNATYSLDRPPEKELEEFDDTAINALRIEWHIIRNCKFSPEDQLLKNIAAIRHIPTIIVQGRYDITCPPQIAYDLKQAFPEADLQVVTAGHAATDPEIMRALVQATDRIRDTGSPLLPQKLNPAYPKQKLPPPWTGPR